MRSWRQRLMTSVAVGILAAGVSAGGVLASQPVSHYGFYDCGPSGPTSFLAVKTATPNGVSGASAFRIVGTNEVFVVLSFSDPSFPPGISRSGQASLACQVDTRQGTFTFYGFIAPA